MTRVFIVDDHPLVRKLVRSACEAVEGLEVVGEAKDGPEAVEGSLRLTPDVVVLDLLLPGLDGLEVARRLRREEHPPRILVLTARDEDEAVLDAMRAGVDGFVDKSADTERVGEAIQAIARGERIFDEAQKRGAVAALGKLARRVKEREKTLSTLSPRERDILPLIAEGVTAREMASLLRLSEPTVRTHLSNLYRKLGVRNRVEAMNRAAALGVSPSSPSPGENDFKEGRPGPE